MTQINEQTDQRTERAMAEDDVSDEREPTRAELLAWRRSNVLLSDVEATPEEFPCLQNVSAGFMFGGVVRPLDPAPPEYVALAMPRTSDVKFAAAVGQWNLLWESAQFRRRFFDLDDLPEPMAKIADLGDVNVTFVPRTRSRYFEYAPLLHLLPKRVLDLFGLPTLRRGQWPFLIDYAGIDEHFGPQHIPQYLPEDWFERHFRDLAGINPHLVRRFAPIRLIQMTAGGSQDTAAALLGVPPGRHQPASLTVRRWTQEATNAPRFDTALEALAGELDNAGNLVDYRHRREALRAWSIPQADWQDLAAELSRRESPRDRARIDWGDHKRRVASVLVWMRVTQGEHLFAPLVLAASSTSVGRSILSRSVQQARHHISTGQAGPHYVDLADALDAYADLLAAHIDNRHDPSLPTQPTSRMTMTELQAATSKA